MELEHEEHRYLINKIAENNGFENYELEVESGSEIGDNYLGQILKIKIKDKYKHINLILKLAPTNEELRKGMTMTDVYHKEVWMYDEGFKALDKFQRIHDWNNRFEGYAKCYGTCDKENREAIAMENLVEKGYKLWNRKIPMNHDHIEIVIREYAKLHAVSFAMNYKDPKMFEDLKESLRQKSDTDIEKMKVWFTAFSENAIKNITRAIEGNNKLEKAFNKFVSECPQFYGELMKDDYVLTHGDCWCNNIMFRYQGINPKVPTKVCFIDWQICKFGHPLMDISYFFLLNSSKETIYNYETYLKIYYETLSDCLRSMSCNPEEIYSYNLLEKDWKRVAKSVIFLAPIIFPVLIVDKNKAATTENFTSPENFFESLTNAGVSEASDQKLRDLLTFMVDTDII